MKRNVLITGGAGFIGLSLARRLLDEGCRVTIVDNFSRAVSDPELRETAGRDGSTLVNADLLDENAAGKLGDDFDVIYHLAAIIGVAHVMGRPYDVLYDNVRMTANMIRCARAQRGLARFLFASTSEVYAGTLSHFDLPVPTPETTPLAVSDLAHPRTSYMLSKIYGEALCHQSGLPFTIFRPHNVYGPRMGMVHVIPEQLRKAHEARDGDSIEVFSHDHTRSFCYIDDAVEMLVLMAKRGECVGKTMNLGNQGPEVTMEDLAGLCWKIAGKELRMDARPASPGSPVRRAPDMTQTIQLTGYRPRVGLEEGIGRTYRWYRENVFDTGGPSAR